MRKCFGWLCVCIYISYLSKRQPQKMLKNPQATHPQTCQECLKTQTLLKKYQKLTHLYQKKQLKLSQNGSSTFSNGRTTNNTMDAHSGEGCAVRMGEVLGKLVKNRYMVFFRLPLRKSAKKFLLLNISNRLARTCKTSAFNNIKQYTQNTTKIHKISSPQQPQQKNKQILQQAPEFPVIKQLLNQTIVKPEQTLYTIIEDLGKLKLISSETHNSHKGLQRHNMELQIANKKLQIENKFLRQCVDELDKRLTKENQKKRETLEELADEISEKNDEIQQLKESLRAYEEVQGQHEKVLEDDLISLRKDLDQMEKLNERLNNDLEKVKNQLLEANKKIKSQDQQVKQIEQQCLKANQNAYQFSLKAAQTQKKSTQYEKLVKSLEAKLKRLTTYQKQLESNILSKILPSFETTKIEQEFKSQLILLFLANISDMGYTLNSEHLFDEQEKGLLISHKQNWIKVMQESQLNRAQPVSKMDCLEISEIQMRNCHMDSVFNALDSPRDRKQGTTMRMLELELEINKQVGKITQLKEKFLHIRVIILRLLKSLQLNSEIKSEAKDILRVVFDLFEYSEEERDSIFIKKKKMFGFI